MTAHRSEKDEEAACDALVKSMLGTVRRYSQPRRTMQTAGISDREYVIFDDVLRWEVKAEDGKLTQEQFDLLREDYEARRTVGCGTVNDLRLVLVMMRAYRRAIGDGWDTPRHVAFRMVELWAARGLRRSKKGKAVAERGAA